VSEVSTSSRDGRRATDGVIDVGTSHLDSDAPERTAVISDDLEVLLPDATEWQTFPRGSVFEVPGASAFEVRATAPAAYLCDYL